MHQKNKIFSTRIDNLRKKFPSYKVDCLIFLNMHNIRYLCGFTGSDGALLINSDKVILFVDGRYIAQAELETNGLQIIRYKDKIEGVSQAINKLRHKYIGFEANAITLEMYNQLKNNISQKNLVALNDELKSLRGCKDTTEIALMAKAAEITSLSIRSIVEKIKPGFTEKEVALKLEMEARTSGADELAFSAIVAAGENAAFPHAKPTNRKIKKGDFVVIDFGVKYKGYCSDETCTIAFGKLTDKQKNAYQLVKNAHERALACVKANVPAARVDQYVRSFYGKKYEKYFVHGTGHGLGLEVHETPRIASDSTDILKANMIVTIEPGFYIPKQWGVRIEDTVLVKENSCEKLTKMDKELIIIE